MRNPNIKRCFTCNKLGHIARFCWYNNENQYFNQSMQGIPESDQPYFQNHNQQSHRNLQSGTYVRNQDAPSTSRINQISEAEQYNQAVQEAQRMIDYAKVRQG